MSRAQSTNSFFPAFGVAQHDILLAAPELIKPAETGAAIAIRLSLTLLFPEQLLHQIRHLSWSRCSTRNGVNPDPRLTKT